MPPRPGTLTPQQSASETFEVEELNHLISVASDAKATLSSKGEFLRADGHWPSVLGRRAEELVGRELLEFLEPAQPDSEQFELLALLEEGPVRNLVAKVRGLERFVSLNAKLHEGTIFLTARDTTTEHSTQESLAVVKMNAQSTVEMLRSVCRVQGRAVFDDDPGTVFDFLLSEFLRITQSEYGFIGEVRWADGRPYLKTHALTNIAWDEESLGFYNDHAPQGLEFHNMQTLFGSAIMTEEPVIANNPDADPRAAGRPDGHPALSSFLGLPLKDPDGMVGLLGLANRARGYDKALLEFIDPLVTSSTSCLRAFQVRRERREAAEELRRSESRRHQLELAHVSRVAAAGELAASLAHELNQPLAAIVTNARAAQRGWSTPDAVGKDDDVDEILTDIVGDAQRAGDIIHKLRNFLRKGQVDTQPIHINSVVRSVVELLRGVDPVGTNCIRLDLEDELPLVEADHTQIEQVLINLVRNALEAMEHLRPVERDVLIQTRLHGEDGVSCSVTDKGHGVDDIDALFDPFFTTKKEGMGMGLPISRTIVEAHGGSLHVAKPPKGGTCMEFVLTSGEGEVCDE